MAVDLSQTQWQCFAPLSLLASDPPPQVYIFESDAMRLAGLPKLGKHLPGQQVALCLHVEERGGDKHTDGIWIAFSHGNDSLGEISAAS
jgi:hypothetical protein